MSAYPTVKQVKSLLRNNLVAPTRRKVLSACIVGSEAKGIARPDSDLDIAVVVEPVRGKTALRLTEEYHGKFISNRFKPTWEGRRVDVQFFYPGDTELGTYSKIELQ